MDLNADESEVDTNRPRDAHKIALELLKQLITLSSGVLALSATFVEQFTAANPWVLAVLVLSWACLITSILLGLEAISAIVKARLSPDFDWSEGRGKWTAAASKYAFVTGIALFAVFAFLFLLGRR